MRIESERGGGLEAGRWRVLSLSLSVCMFVVMVVGWIQIISKAGAVDPQNIATQEKALALVLFVDMIANFVLFVIFAFSEWPVMRVARSRPLVPGGGGRPPTSPSTAAALATPGGQMLPPWPQSPPGAAGQPPVGWHRTGAVGEGEQSYWNGSVWTARRRWTGARWVDLSIQQPAPGGPDETAGPPGLTH